MEQKFISCSLVRRAARFKVSWHYRRVSYMKNESNFRMCGNRRRVTPRLFPPLFLPLILLLLLHFLLKRCKSHVMRSQISASWLSINSLSTCCSRFLRCSTLAVATTPLHAWWVFRKYFISRALCAWLRKQECKLCNYVKDMSHCCCCYTCAALSCVTHKRLNLKYSHPARTRWGFHFLRAIYLQDYNLCVFFFWVTQQAKAGDNAGFFFLV